MTPDQLAQLDTVQGDGNALPYEALPGPQEPADWYTDVPVPWQSFVCRDYVQYKASRLKALGWDGALLRELVCELTAPDPDAGEWHAVLAVADPALGPGDPDPYILDNRQQNLYRQSVPPPGYRWRYLQVAGSAGFAPVG